MKDASYIATALERTEIDVTIIIDGHAFKAPNGQYLNQFLRRLARILTEPKAPLLSQKRYNQVHKLSQIGHTVSQIGHKMDLKESTIEGYLRCDTYEDWRAVYNPPDRVYKKRKRRSQKRRNPKIPAGSVCYECGGEKELDLFRGRVLCSECLVVRLEDDMEDARETALQNAGSVPSSAATVMDWNAGSLYARGHVSKKGGSQ